MQPVPLAEGRTQRRANLCASTLSRLGDEHLGPKLVVLAADHVTHYTDARDAAVIRRDKTPTFGDYILMKGDRP